ncbi:hydrogenase maturation nickel metallochaperone HypA [Novipirellula caenicola]|uniref:Hydrogenase maturation factor HypA n=1 Tax=Novipirellula caenicola TaxID=1536901 RepID=A0ABP9VWW1_9BACT
MHELSIAIRIIDIAEEESRKHDDACVMAVHLKIGCMSGVVIEALLSAFEIAREETLLAHAELKIEALPVKVRCPKCDCEQLADSIQCLCCSVCRTLSPEITQGRELEVVAVELEPLETVQ